MRAARSDAGQNKGGKLGILAGALLILAVCHLLSMLSTVSAMLGIPLVVWQAAVSTVMAMWMSWSTAGDYRPQGRS
jgi:hypothetical protein